MNRIIYLTNSPHSYSGAGGRTRVISVALLHQKIGYNTLIFCFVPISKFFNVRSLLKARKDLSYDSKSKVFYLPTLVTFKVQTLISIRDLITKLIIKSIIGVYKPSVIHCHGLHASYLGVKSLGRRALSFLVADIHGASPEEAAFTHGLEPDHPRIKYLNSIEAFVFANANMCVFVSNQMINHVKCKHGFLPDKYIIIPCATDIDNHNYSRTVIRKRLGLEDQNQIAFVYLGSFRKYQMANETLKLFHQIKSRLPKCRLFIFTSHLKQFKAAAMELGFDDSSYTIMNLKREEVSKFLNAMDIGFMLRQDEVLNKVASPTKFAEYVVNGVPVITTSYAGDYSEIAKKNNVGFVLDEIKNSDDLIKFILDVQSNRLKYLNKCMSFGKNNLTWDSFYDNYSSNLPKVVPN